ncbi:hypothetical protein [Pseudomonas sp. MWU13-2100]|uniref:hypothetical protein n=1 Tax=Pseudomonas sp. MWU13-2100 TaxID=2935075 RepID=UPI0020108709|nr:hypothetical protein [Pseudomonas sp. MWU13-2100]
MTRDQLIDAVLAEMERVWGENGFGGETEEYKWLYENYGISEEDDIHWQDVCNDWGGTLQESLEGLGEEVIAEAIEFINDDTRVVKFLEKFLKQYRSSTAVYYQESEG